MFYDTERIVRKQEKYEKTKAYATISKLKSKGLSVSEAIDAISILLEDDNTESQQAILERAKRILQSEKESLDEECTEATKPGSSNVPGCPLLVRRDGK